MGRASAAQVIEEATAGQEAAAAPPEPAKAPLSPEAAKAGAAGMMKAMEAEELVQAMDARVKFIRTKRPNPATDVKRHGGEGAYSEFDVCVPDEITPEDIVMDPGYLYPIQERGVARFDLLIVHNRTFKWEARFRVMILDKTTQEMICSPIGPTVRHNAKPSSFNWNSVRIEDMGTAGYRVTFKNTVLVSGLETYEDAEEFINRKKNGVRE